MSNEDKTVKRCSCLIIIPTYREHENIRKLYKALEQQEISYDFLIIDDGSDDGTQKLLQDLQSKNASITFFQRHKKLGLGSAYILALAYARYRDYKYIVQMDADMSHQPEDVSRLVEFASSNDVVIGSRYTPGGRCQGWPWHRYLLSRAANWLAKSLLQLKQADVTGGFRCIRRDFLKQVSLEKIISTGFAFQCDFNQLAAKSGAKFMEVPICFQQRTVGKSKMSIGIIIEGVLRLIQIRFRRKNITVSNYDDRGPPFMG